MSFITRDAQGQLCVADMPLADCAETFGTPLYVYAGDGIIEHYRQFEAALKGLNHRINYAVKANAALGVITLLAQHGAGADIVSGGEMQRALKAGIPPEKIVYSGVGKNDAEIRAALQQKIQINAESKAEIERIEQIAQKNGQIASIALRVNVNVDAGSHAKISTGQKTTKFGIAVADGEAAACYRYLNQSPHIHPQGLAVHIGSQIRDLTPYQIAYAELLALAQSLEASGLHVPELDLGGGLGVDYGGGMPPDFANYGALVKQIFGGHHYRLGFEPGRSIVADNGVLLTKTLYVKQGEHKRFIIVDAGMNDLIRPTLYDAYHRIEPVAHKGEATGIADIVGPICETGDYLGLGREMPDLDVGDLLAVLSAGAYGAAMMSNYNSRAEAAEVMILEGTPHLLRPRRTIEDMLKLEHNPLR